MANTTERPTTTDELSALLAHHSGSEEFFRHPIGRFVYTQGVQQLAEVAGAYWLLDVIGSYQGPKLAKMPFQVWRVESDGSKGLVTMREDTDQPIKVSQRLPFTDFPTGTFELFFINNTLLLKSEY